ncbi:MAG: hypothetical protein KTR25_04695, partial [Myxococcales bacterium]|nr:hypothetical protein [Myxococcales bacterium]
QVVAQRGKVRRRRRNLGSTQVISAVLRTEASPAWSLVTAYWLFVALKRHHFPAVRGRFQRVGPKPRREASITTTVPGIVVSMGGA